VALPPRLHPLGRLCIPQSHRPVCAYLSYEFSNRSAQIRELFMDACDLVDVEYRPYKRYVRIYRRASVASMQEHVGLKA
jgi:hypothetical protein